MAQNEWMQSIKNFLKGYFDLTSELENEQSAVESIMDGISFKGSNIIILIIAIFIASLGLNTNSAAVIIGAMLISPLMGPIIGMGYGLGIYDFETLKRSFRNLAVATLVSVIASTIFFVIFPVSEGRSELLARTSPTIYDVMIGFFGGLAGIVALACKKKGNVIPGVAIATALMPPLCTAGYGLGTWQLQYFFGAFYLFLINSIFIGFATTLGVKFMGFKHHNFIEETTKVKVKRYATAIIIVTLLPSIWLTFTMLRDSYFTTNANKFINEEFNFPNAQVLNKETDVKHGNKYITVTLIGERMNIDSLQVVMTKRLDENRWLRGTNLTIKQGVAIDAQQNIKTLTSSMFNEIYADNQRKISELTNQIDSLKLQLESESEFARLSEQLVPEIKVLFPDVIDIALSRNLFSTIDKQSVDTVNLAIIKTGKNMSRTEREKFKEYLEVRSGVKPIVVVSNNELKVE